jgi:hypothetical protein
MNYLNDLNTPLLKFSDKKGDVFTLDDATRGVLSIGGTGSGKTSGSGKTLAKAYLTAGFGGLVVCHKPDEAKTWKRYAKETGRENSLVVLDGTAQRRFNFIDYELNRIDKGGNNTPLALDVFMKIYEFKKVVDGSGSDNNGSFWSDSVRLLLSHSIDALFLAYGEIKFSDLMQFIREIPSKLQETETAEHQTTFYFLTLVLACENSQENPERIATMRAVTNWLDSFIEMDKKTRSNIIATLDSMALDFTKGDIAKIFCTSTNVVPEMSEHGAIFLLDFPLETWQRGGIIAQNIFKYAWVRAMQRRSTAEPFRPVFLWCDEYQAFTNSYDVEFTATARSKKICTVFLTQSIPTLKAALNTNATGDAVETIISNLQTRIIHSCMDEPTRLWAANSIGKGLVYRYSENEGINEGQGRGEGEGRGQGQGGGINHHSHGFLDGGGGRAMNSNENHNRNTNNSQHHGRHEGRAKNQVIDYLLQPAFFGSQLRRGSKENRFLVDGVIVSGGKIWKHTGKPFLIASFNQKT